MRGEEEKEEQIKEHGQELIPEHMTTPKYLNLFSHSSLHHTLTEEILSVFFFLLHDIKVKSLQM